MTTTRWTRAVLLVLTITLVSCSSPDQPEPDVEHFAVRITHIETLDVTGQWSEQSLADPVPYANRVRVAIEVRPLPSDRAFDGFVRVLVEPGYVVGLTSETHDVSRTGLAVSTGNPGIAVVDIEGAFGDTRIVVEDVGHDPGPAMQAACDDGIDNDGDGRVDYPSDPGCFLRNDRTETPGTHAVGVSEPIVFANPRISNVQGCNLVPDLERQAITVDRGEMYVTAVTVKGFYVSDFSFLRGGCDPTTGCCDGGRYAHLYAYNFNTPQGMRVCDRLASFGGIVGDFYGFTELNFPHWERYDIDEDPSNGLTLMRLEPRAITENDCPIDSSEIEADDVPNRRLMETYESALVHVVNAQLPTEWINCDFNDNGDAAFNFSYDQLVPADEVILPDDLRSAYCPDEATGFCSEAACSEACVARNCAELTTYGEHGQYPILIGEQPILVVTNANVPEFNPYRMALNSDGPVVIDRIGGMLKEFAPLDTPWIIEPRCPQDIYINGDSRFGAFGDDDVPIWQRCVPSEETGDYEDPY